MRFTIAARLALVTAAIVLGTAGLLLALVELMPDRPVFASALAAAAMVPLGVIAMRSQLQPILTMMRTLGGTVISYRDGDFSFGVHWKRNDEVRDLVDAHNALGSVLRDQRLNLVQRELL